MHLVEKTINDDFVCFYDVIHITLFTGPKGGDFEPEEKHCRKPPMTLNN
jgi:hypothetical protein